ncbi:hypothetical protein BDR26DRAFT_931182 [Obelidium mucronatum]|nr:hypothetical protein BDR26DRAFT_931182 [Obelidium mucronatum]
MSYIARFLNHHSRTLPTASLKHNSPSVLNLSRSLGTSVSAPPPSTSPSTVVYPTSTASPYGTHEAVHIAEMKHAIIKIAKRQFFLDVSCVVAALLGFLGFLQLQDEARWAQDEARRAQDEARWAQTDMVGKLDRIERKLDAKTELLERRQLAMEDKFDLKLQLRLQEIKHVRDAQASIGRRLNALETRVRQVSRTL